MQPFLDALQALRTPPPTRAARARALDEFRWSIEEFRVSLFAQELGTAQPVSAKRLAAQLQDLRNDLRS